MWDETLFEPLKEQLNDYPLRQLVEVLKELDQTQRERIDLLKGELDGKMWSPSEW